MPLPARPAAALLLLLAARPGAAAPADGGLSAAEALEVGDHLLREGDPAGALGWYRAADLLSPRTGGVDPDAVQLRLGLALERSGQPQAAVVAYGRVGGEAAERARLREGVAAFRAGATRRGDEALAALAGSAADPELRAAAALQRCRLWLEQGDPARARAALEALPADHPERRRAAALVARLDHPLHLKSAGLAAGLSVLPAVGQAYAGDPRAARTLGAWGAFAAGAALTGWWGWKEGSPAALGVSGALGTGMVLTWGRGIGEAAKAAESANRAAEAARRARWAEAAAAEIGEGPPAW
jgi:hypothetical protein